MSNTIGTLESTSGSVSVSNADGEKIPLSNNMAIPADAIVKTGMDGAAVVRFNNGSALNIGADEFVLMDQTVYDDEALAEDETQTEVERLQAILAESPDLSVFEETASGEAVAVGGSSIIVDSIEKHNVSNAQSGSTMIGDGKDNSFQIRQDDDDSFGRNIDPNSLASTPFVTLDNLITNNTTPILTGTISDPNARIVITVAGQEIVGINNGDGTWQLPVTTPLPEGDTIISVITQDENGNDTTVTATITIDTINPIITIDNITTNDNTPTIGGTINEDDATIVVTVNGVDITATNNGDGTWSLPLTDTLPEGDNVITVTATDPAGNTTTESGTIVIDTVAPSITLDDLITNDTTPIISGTTDDPNATIIVTVNDGATIGGQDYVATVNTDGTWSVEITTPLDEGEVTLSVTATDTTGNSTSISDSVTIDISNDDHNGTGTGTNGDDATITLNAISDDDRINTYETNNSTTIISGTTTAVDGSTISILVNGGLFTTVTAQNGTFSYTVDNSVFANYPDGLYTVTAEVVADQAGNVVSSSREVLLDTDFVATIALDANLFGDDIINDIESKSETLAITGTSTAANGTPVSITIDGNPFTTAIVQNGTFSVDIDANVFTNYPDGNYTLEASISDVAGNQTSDTRDITLDRTLNNGGYVGEPITIDSITEDTGSSNSDFITSDNDLTISGTYNNQLGNTITVTVNGTDYTVDSGITVTGNIWSLETGLLPDGTTTITAVITDPAGNTKTVTQALTVDTLADSGDGTTPAEIQLDPISGGYINAQEAGSLLTIEGTSNVIGATVNLTINGSDLATATVQADGTFSVMIDTTVIATYPDGSYTVEATIITDAAGNEVSSSQNVILDTTLDSGGDYPGTNNVSIDAITEDTGTADDYITSDTTLVISGTFNAESGNSLTVKVDSTIYNADSSELTINGNNWSLDLSTTPLSQGVYTVTATVEDDAGNRESAVQDITVVASTDLGIINLHEISGDYINLEESQQDLDITGVSTALGQTVTFELNGQPLVLGGVAATAVVQADGTFTLTIPADTFTGYPDGVYDVTANVITVGGITATATEDVTLDRSVTGGPGGGGTGGDGSDATIILSNVSDGYINAQEAATGVMVSGTTTAVEGTVITFIFETAAGDTYPITTTANGQTITANADGTFSAFIDLGDLSGVDNSNISVTAEVVADKAGNIATSDSVDVFVDLSAGTLSDDSAPTPVYESALDTGSSPSIQGRSTHGNLFDNDTNVGNSTISNISVNGQQATPVAGNSNMLVVDTTSGLLYVAINDTTFNGVNYNAGDYTYTLEDASNATSEEIVYTLEDDAGNTSSANLTIDIVDDAPIANEDGVVNKYLDANTSGYSTNLILTLDTSGSMNSDAEGDYPGDRHYSGFWPFGHWVDDFDSNTVRIDLAKDALKNLIDQYADLGDVNIQIITFSDTATASTMLNATDAKAYIDGITADGGTMYDNAVAEAMQNPVDSYPDANTTQYYFISDGQPNSGGGLNSAETDAWNSYIENSPIDKTFAIGVGTGGSSGELDKIAATHGETIIINSITDLDGTLQQTVNNTIITGELTSFDADGTVAAIGADGGHITSIVLDGTTYTYDAANPTQTISTPLGATFNVNFETGSYTYVIDYNDATANQTETMTITVADADNDTVTNDIVFHLQTPPNGDENFAYNSNNIDGLAGFDTIVLSGAETLDFNNVNNLNNIEALDLHVGDNTLLNLDVTDIINMTDASNELFIYGEAGDNVALDTNLIDQNTTVTDADGRVFNVYSDVDSTATVNIEQEIIVS